MPLGGGNRLGSVLSPDSRTSSSDIPSTRRALTLPQQGGITADRLQLLVGLLVSRSHPRLPVKVTVTSGKPPFASKERSTVVTT